MSSGLWGIPPGSDAIQAKCPYCDWSQGGADWDFLSEQLRTHLELAHAVPVIEPEQNP